MTARQLLDALRKRWRLLLLCLLLCVAAAALYAFNQPTRYRAEAQIFVAAREQSGNAANAYQGSLFSQDRIKSYVSLVNKQPVLEPVASRLGLSYGWQRLAQQVGASSPDGTVLIDLTATDASPVQAQAIANVTALQLSLRVKELETLDDGRSPVRLSISQPAQLPSSPASPRKARDLVIGLLLGLALGCAAAVLKELSDTSLKSSEDIRDRLGTNSLGLIPFDANTVKYPLITAPQAARGRREALRQLRTNLQFTLLGPGPHVIVVTSPLPGDGKTMTAVNLALSMAEARRNVVLIDADLRRPRVADALGLNGALGLTSVLLGSTSWSQALQIVDVSRGGRLRVLTSGAIPPNPAELLAAPEVTDLLTQIGTEADVIVIDSPPVLPVADASIISTRASGVLLVLRHGVSRRDQADKALRALATVHAKVLGAVLNRVPLRGPEGMAAYGEYYSYASNLDDDWPQVQTAVPPASGASTTEVHQGSHGDVRSAPPRPHPGPRALQDFSPSD